MLSVDIDHRARGIQPGISIYRIAVVAVLVIEVIATGDTKHGRCLTFNTYELS